MYRLRILVVFLLFSSPAASPAQEWRRAAEYDVLLSSYDIEPETIHLMSGAIIVA